MPKPERVFTTDPLEVMRCTELAVGVRGDNEIIWMPFSKIEEPDEEYIRKSVGDEIEFTIPYWLAEEKGFV